MSKHRAVVIGLDGATWELLLPWAKSGFLPNLQRLLKKGVHGDLQTVHPDTTAPAWSSFATGKNPGKHGVFDFLTPQNSLSQLSPVTSKDIKTETFYELIAREGHQVILINLPVSYPPRLNGKDHITITSLMTQGDECIFPSNLKQEFTQFNDYRLSPNPDIAANGTIEEFVSDVREVEAKRFECGKVLFKRKDWDLFFYLISGTDWIQHRLFNKLIEGKLPKDHQALQAYQEFDHYLGWFMDHLPENTYLFVISDHGFTAHKGFFYVNTWLWREDYLKVQPQPKRRAPVTKAAAQRQRETRGKLISAPSCLAWMLSRSPFLDKIVRALWEYCEQWLPFKITLSQWSANSAVPDQSKAYMTGEGVLGIYLNTQKRFQAGLISDDKYSTWRDELIKQLKSLQDPQTNKPVFDWVAPAEAIYHGPYIEHAPDVLFYSDLFQVDVIIPAKSMLFRWALSNGHSNPGILSIYGPHVRQGQILNQAQLLDIAPTILHLMDLPVIKNMDGEIVGRAFNPNSPPVVHPVKKVADKWTSPSETIGLPPSDEATVKSRLKDLGYLD